MLTFKSLKRDKVIFPFLSLVVVINYEKGATSKFQLNFYLQLIDY